MRGFYGLFRPPPEEVSADLKTDVSDLHLGRGFYLEAEKRLHELEGAADDDCLRVEARWHTVTRTPGLILTDGNGEMLAELLSPTGELDEDAKIRTDWLTLCAFRGELSLLVHVSDPKHCGDAQAFATLVTWGATVDFEYLARLLLGGLDFAQWDLSRRDGFITQGKLIS